MRQLTESENKASNHFFAECDIESGAASTDRALFKAGFIAGLEYQDKRIEALEAIIKNALNEAYQSEVLDTQMESSLIGNAYADKQDWLDSRIEEWK